MTRPPLFLVLPLLLLSACGTQAPLASRQVALAPLRQTVVVGVTTKAQVLERFGPTTEQVFDDGRAVWLYHDGDTELVLLFDRAGIVRKTRQSVPLKYD